MMGTNGNIQVVWKIMKCAKKILNVSNNVINRLWDRDSIYYKYKEATAIVNVQRERQ